MAEKCCYDNAPCSPDVRDEWDKGRTKETTSEALCYLVTKDPKNCRVNSKNDRYEPCIYRKNWHGGHGDPYGERIREQLSMEAAVE